MTLIAEQVTGEAVDHRSDVFSLGAILYEMITGRRAFLHDTAVETMAAIVKEPAASLGSGPPVSQGMEQISWSGLSGIAGCLIFQEYGSFDRTPARQLELQAAPIFRCRSAAQVQVVRTALRGLISKGCQASTRGNLSFSK